MRKSSCVLCAAVACLARAICAAANAGEVNCVVCTAPASPCYCIGGATAIRASDTFAALPALLAACCIRVLSNPVDVREGSDLGSCSYYPLALARFPVEP